MRGRPVRLLQLAWRTAVLAAAVIGVATLLHQDLSTAGAIAIAALVVGLLNAAAALARAPHRPALATYANDPGSRPFQRLYWLRERLIVGSRSPDAFASTVVPILAAVARDRLARRHGIDVKRGRAAAAALIGEPLVDLLDGTRPADPSDLARVADYVTVLERL